MPDFHVTFRDLLHAVNLRHGTDGFTSPPKEGVLRIFFALKNPTASAGFEPANLGTKGQHATSRPPKPFGIISFMDLISAWDIRRLICGSRRNLHKFMDSLVLLLDLLQLHSPIYIYIYIVLVCSLNILEYLNILTEAECDYVLKHEFNINFSSFH